MEQVLGQVLGLLEAARITRACGIALQTVHASDLADLVEHLEDDSGWSLLQHIPSDLAADTLAEMEDVERPGELLLQLEPERTAEIVHEMADDDAADVIGELEPEEQARVLAAVADEEAAEIEELLTYAGGVGRWADDPGGPRRYPFASRPAEAIAEIRRQAHEDFDFYTIFVVDPDGTFRGVVALQDLVIADPATSIADHRGASRSSSRWTRTRRKSGRPCRATTWLRSASWIRWDAWWGESRSTT